MTQTSTGVPVRGPQAPPSPGLQDEGEDEQYEDEDEDEDDVAAAPDPVYVRLLIADGRLFERDQLWPATPGSESAEGLLGRVSYIVRVPQERAPDEFHVYGVAAKGSELGRSGKGLFAAIPYHVMVSCEGIQEIEFIQDEIEEYKMMRAEEKREYRNRKAKEEAERDKKDKEESQSAQPGTPRQGKDNG